MKTAGLLFFFTVGAVVWLGCSRSYKIPDPQISYKQTEPEVTPKLSEPGEPSKKPLSLAWLKQNSDAKYSLPPSLAISEEFLGTHPIRCETACPPIGTLMSIDRDAISKRAVDFCYKTRT